MENFKKGSHYEEVEDNCETQDLLNVVERLTKDELNKSLISAIKKGDVPDVRRCLDAGADLDHRNAAGNGLHLAARQTCERCLIIFTGVIKLKTSLERK